ncbi:hypothetical protein BJV77DRAFT_1063253 [Russula vinacea]|nr:hypothetical protein BJV77DRAFT_1063253 [Russula vinacea]
MPRSRSPDSQRSKHLPGSAEPITESDYFLKSSEFRVWLKEEKHKYFDELSGDKARRYFHKFVKEWNRGKLDKSLYAGVDPSKQTATSQTAYKWAFTSNRTKADNDALQVARAEVGAATYGVGNGPSTTPGDGNIKRRRKQQQSENISENGQAEARERVEDAVGPREVGRERMLEKKRERREDVDEGTLMGGGDSFKAQIARRDAARARFEQRREDKTSATRERAAAIREKDKATMDMFMQMAKQKYG